MKQSSFKNFQLFKPRTKYMCRACNCSYKVYGDTWIEVQKSVLSTDGSKAFRIFWLGHCGHRQFRGYSKPVSWKKNLGGDRNLVEEEKTFEELDAEEENEYQEMVDYAAKMKNSGSGKRFF